MQTKLTLRLDDRLVKDAKLYARRTGKSLSQMAAEYFSAVTSPPAVCEELTPAVSAKSPIPVHSPILLPALLDASSPRA